MNKVAGTVSGVSATLSSTNPGVAITQPSSTYPNLPASGTSTNSTPFQISTSPSLICGTNIDLLLTVNTATNGSFSVPIRMFTGTAGTQQRFNLTGDQSIPDLGTLNSTINVSGITTPIHHIVVSLHLSHTTDDNLHLSLGSPDGVFVDLSSDNGGASHDYGTSCAEADRTTFSDSAAVPITAGTAPFRGNFRPELPLSVYRGKFDTHVNGAWRLSISDDTAGGLGTLHCWAITIFPTACTPGGGECEVCPGCPQRLSIARVPASDGQVVLTWSTSAVGYNLISTNAAAPFPFPAFTPVNRPVVVVNSKFTLTDTNAGAIRFYQLRKP
jgi:subtilisin-like proprotein convertase family protein